MDHVLFPLFPEQAAVYVVEDIKIFQAQDLAPGLLKGFCLRDGGHQTACVCMPRLIEHLAHIPLFHKLALIDHQHAAAQLPDHI